MMRPLVSGLALFLALGGVAGAQNTSQVFGKVTDVSGGVMPGVTVTLSSPALLEPRVALTSVTGTYEFPGLGIGMYMVRFEGDRVRVRRAGRGVLVEPMFASVVEWFAELDRFAAEPFMADGRRQPPAPERTIFSQ